MQRITLDSEISYVVSEKELKEIREDERRKTIDVIENVVLDIVENGYNYPSEEFKNAIISIVYDTFVDARNKMKEGAENDI